MTVVFQRRSRRQRLRVAAAAVLFLALLPAGSAPAEDVINIYLDQAKLTRLPDRVATIVVGNPLIADVALQGGGMMVLTGKGYGVTNLIALDRNGTVLMNQAVQVLGPQDNVVVVYRGSNRESYSCAPDCERRITLGDTPEFFEATISQTGNRNARAQGGQQQMAR
jgi:hypothetical protein